LHRPLQNFPRRSFSIHGVQELKVEHVVFAVALAREDELLRVCGVYVRRRVSRKDFKGCC
jgi:hypothetical protein